MNKRIKELELQLADTRTTRLEIESKMQVEYNKIFKADKKLAKAIQATEDSVKYTTGESGDIESWCATDSLRVYSDCAEYLENWLMENHFMRPDFDNDCLLMSHGDDNLIIQDDARRGDNGVWQSQRMIIDQDAYTTEDGEIDVKKRNALIEAHMEKTGYFPGVFRVDQYGNVTPVSTNNEGDSK